MRDADPQDFDFAKIDCELTRLKVVLAVSRELGFRDIIADTERHIAETLIPKILTLMMSVDGSARQALAASYRSLRALLQ